MVNNGFFAHPFLLLTLLIGLYWLVMVLRRRSGSPFVNPVLICTVLWIVYLKLTATPYEQFEQTGRLVSIWLQPAVVCLAVPLYLQWPKIRAQWWPLLCSQAVGCVIGIVSGVGMARLLGASDAVSTALAAKSVTLPVALEVTRVLDGVPSISAAGVIVAGLTGQMFGFFLMRRAVANPVSKSLAMGTASHAMGIAACLEKGGRFAAYATLGLILNGVMTAFLAPLVVPWLMAV